MRVNCQSAKLFKLFNNFLFISSYTILCIFNTTFLGCQFMRNSSAFQNLRDNQIFVLNLEMKDHRKMKCVSKMCTKQFLTECIIQMDINLPQMFLMEKKFQTLQKIQFLDKTFIIVLCRKVIWKHCKIDSNKECIHSRLQCIVIDFLCLVLSYR